MEIRIKEEWELISFTWIAVENGREGLQRRHINSVFNGEKFVLLGIVGKMIKHIPRS